MEGVYLFYSAAALRSNPQSTTSFEPSIIVLSLPRKRLAIDNTTTGCAPCVPVSVCDVDLLQLLYLAFPSSFMVLLSTEEPNASSHSVVFNSNQRNNFYDRDWAASACDEGLEGEAAPAQLTSSETYRLAKEREDAFFASSVVQQRTCRLTLGTNDGSSGDTFSSSSRRHRLNLSPSAAGRIMMQHAWLKDLHECPHTLCYAAQVAAALLLHSTTPLHMSAAATLELVTQCGWIGDAQTAAALLTCVTRTISAEEQLRQSVADPAAMARARRGLPPPLPAWISGHAHHHKDESSAMPQSPLLSVVAESGSGVQLRIQEAYCTYTSGAAAAAAVGTEAVNASSANVLGGSIGMSYVSADEEQHKTADQSNHAVPTGAAETVHVLIFTSLGGAVSEEKEDAVRPPPRCLLAPLLRFLQTDLTPPGVDNTGELDLQLHISVNGRDVLQTPPAASVSTTVDDEELLRCNASTHPSLSAPLFSPLVGRPIEEAQRALDADFELDHFIMREEEEDGVILTRMFDQCEATLRHVHHDAHRHRLLWVRQQALQRNQRLQRAAQTATPANTSNTEAAASAPRDLPAGAVDVPPPTRSAVIFCTDEYHLAQWAESGHPLTVPAHDHDADGDGDENGGAGTSPWAAYYGTPVYVCLIPSSAVSPPRLLVRLCDAPSVIKGLRAARQLCTRTHGFLFIGDDHGTPPHDAAAETRGAREVAKTCDAVMAALAAHLHAWVTATYRDVHWCVFSELPKEPKTSRVKRSSESERRRAARASAGAAARTDGLPHCEVCAPAVVAQIRNTAAHVRLWRCPETLLSASTPAAPFLTYESIPAPQHGKNSHAVVSSSGSASATNKSNGPTSGGSTPQPWIEELVAQYAFAFAHTRRGSGVLRAVSAVVRVQPRLALFKPGPLLQWYNRQFHLHYASVALAAVLEAQVEQVKSMFFVLAATENGRNVRRGSLSARAREAQAEAVMKSLQRLTARVTRLREGDQAVLNTLRHLLPFESLDDRRAVAVPLLSVSASAPLYISQRATAPLPVPLLSVIREVENARKIQFREQQRKEYQLGEPLAPSPANASAAVARLLSLMFLKARMMEVHAVYAAGGGDYLMSLAERAVAGKGKPRKLYRPVYEEPAVPAVMPRANPLMEPLISRDAAGLGVRGTAPPSVQQQQQQQVSARPSVTLPPSDFASVPVPNNRSCERADAATVVPACASLSDDKSRENDEGEKEDETKDVRVDAVEPPSSSSALAPTTTRTPLLAQYEQEAAAVETPDCHVATSNRTANSLDVFEYATPAAAPEQSAEVEYGDETAAVADGGPERFDVVLPTYQPTVNLTPAPMPHESVIAYDGDASWRCSANAGDEISAPFRQNFIRLRNQHVNVQQQQQKPMQMQVDQSARQQFDVRLPAPSERQLDVNFRQRDEHDVHEAVQHLQRRESPEEEQEERDTLHVIAPPPPRETQVEASLLPWHMQQQQQQREAIVDDNHADDTMWVHLPGESAELPFTAMESEKAAIGVDVATPHVATRVTGVEVSVANSSGDVVVPPPSSSQEWMMQLQSPPPAAPPPRPPTPPLTPLSPSTNAPAAAPLKREKKEKAMQAKVVHMPEDDAVQSPAARSADDDEDAGQTVAARDQVDGSVTAADPPSTGSTSSTSSTQQNNLEDPVEEPRHLSRTPSMNSSKHSFSARDKLDSPTHTYAGSDDGVFDPAPMVSRVSAISAGATCAPARRLTALPPPSSAPEPHRADATPVNAAASFVHLVNDSPTATTQAATPVTVAVNAGSILPSRTVSPPTLAATPTPSPPPPPPPPLRDLRWCGTLPTQPVTRIEDLVTSQLPSRATAHSVLLRAARYAAGLVTVDTMDATTAAAAAALSAPSPTAAQRQQQQQRGSELLKAQPSAHLALFAVDVTSGALRLHECLPCVVAPSVATSPHRFAQSPSEEKEAEKPQSSDLESRFCFRTHVAPGTAVAVVYVGLSRSLQRGVTLQDVLWVDGVVFAVAAPRVRQVRVTAMQANSFAVQWTASTATAVKLLISEIATPPLDATLSTSSTASLSPHLLEGTKKREEEEEEHGWLNDVDSPVRNGKRNGQRCTTNSSSNGRSSVYVGHTSPTVVGGLKSASIYHVQVMPIPSAKQTVRLATDAKKELQSAAVVTLETIIDAAASACAVMAATTVTPSLDFMRVGNIAMTTSHKPSPSSPDLKKKKEQQQQQQNRRDGDDEGDSIALSDNLYVTGTVVSPLLQYRTAAFPASVLRHCNLFSPALGAAAAAAASVDVAGVHAVTSPPTPLPPHQLVRLHFTLVPLFNQDADQIEEDEGKKSSAADFHIAAAPQRGRIHSAVPTKGDRCAHEERTCRHIFCMKAGEEVGLSLSLCVQLDAELAALSSSRARVPSSSATPLQYASVFEAVQRRTLQTVLGPFHTCGPAIRVGEVSLSAAELSWEGTSSEFEVRVVKKQTNVAASGAAGFCNTRKGSGEGAPQVFRVRGQRVRAAHPIALTSERVAAQHPLPRLGNRYRAVLRLSTLQPASEYAVSARCVVNHIGAAAMRVWHTRPLSPPPQSCHIVFDSATRQLFLRFLQQQQQQQQQQSRLSIAEEGSATAAAGTAGGNETMSRAVYEVVVEPLGTTLTVPVVGEAVTTSGEDAARAGVVPRVVDCSVVAPGTPIRVLLRQCVEWSTTKTLAAQLAGSEKEEKDSRSSRSNVRTESDAVVCDVVSNIIVRAARDELTQPIAVTKAEGTDAVSPSESLLELTWTCSDDAASQMVRYVELNGSCRVPVDSSGTANRLPLTLADIVRATRCGGAPETDKANGSRNSQRSSPPSCTGSLVAAGSKSGGTALWSGVLCVTSFGGPTTAADDIAGTVSRRQLVPDRCTCVILPPPPDLAPSLFVLKNFQDEACVDVDVSKVYARYYDALRGSTAVEQSTTAENTEAAAAPGIMFPEHQLVAAAQQHVCLSLEVRRDADDGAVQHYPLFLNQRRFQRIRIPLPSYRPYDGLLHLSLCVAAPPHPVPLKSAADQTTKVTESPAKQCGGAAITAVRNIVLCTPLPSSRRVTSLPAPPAEPITDVFVSAIAAQSAVVDWTPPLSLLRHLRQHPSTPVGYEVQLHQGSVIPPTAESDAAEENKKVSTLCNYTRELPVKVWVSAEPHLVLGALDPATPYVVQVRGTGFGDYYGTVQFVTAPVVAESVVAQLRASLTVETVVAVPTSDRRRNSSLRERRAETLSRAGNIASPHPPPGHAGRRPALWAVLPASSVICWAAPQSASEHDNRNCQDPDEGETTVVEVVTQYTASLVSAGGELLRQWTSSAETATTLYEEWDSARRDGEVWPHLEVSAQAGVRVRAGCDQRESSNMKNEHHGIEGSSCGAFVLPHPSQSGLHRRMRLDLIGMPHLSCSSDAGTCALSWEGSCAPHGYCVSWCQGSHLANVQHTVIPSTPSPAPLCLTLDEARGAAGGEGPDVVLVCISGCVAADKSSQRSRNIDTADLIRTPSGISSGGSNVLCAAWLVPPTFSQSTEAEAAVVYSTAEKVTLLLPHSYPDGSEKEETKMTLSAETRSSAAGASTHEIARALAALLERQWSVVPAAATTATKEVAQLTICPWTVEQYVAAGLRTATEARDVVLPGERALVDIRKEHPTNGSVDKARAVVELRCVDSVVDKQAPVWQQLVDHVMHTHTTHFVGQSVLVDLHSSGNEVRAAVVPTLRWLQSVVETTREVRLPGACTLQDLTLCAVDEAGVVTVPPLTNAVKQRNVREGEKVGQATARAVTEGPQRSRRWLPLQTAPAATENRASRDGNEVPLCQLNLFVGSRHDGEEARATAEESCVSKATLAELEALQSWTQRGHPTLRVRLSWVSDDDSFVLRIAGPYETSGSSADCRGEMSRTARSAADVVAAPAVVKSDSVEAEAALRSALQTALSPDHFPSVEEMPRQRTYTCVPAPKNEHGGEAAKNVANYQGDAGEYIALHPDGTVGPAVATEASARASSSLSCRRFFVEVDGLLPESFYRVQVCSSHSGDAALRLQFVTPPSCLTQVVTISDDAVERDEKAAVLETGTVCLSSAQQMRVHARVYNPHAYDNARDDAPLFAAGAQEAVQRHALAPGLHYNSYATLEVVHVDDGGRSGPCLREHCTYSSSSDTDVCSSRGPACAAGGNELMEVDKDGAVWPVTESSFEVAVDGAVLVNAVRHLTVVVSSSADAEAFVQPTVWGPVQCLLSSPCGTVSSAALEPSVPQRLHARLTLCQIPALPRMESLQVLQRTPHSLQLGWQWWSSRPQRGSTAAETAETLLCVQCCRVSNSSSDRIRAATTTSRGGAVEASQLHLDGCTAIVPVSPHPVAHLAPLQPGTLYVICIREIAREHAADARAASPLSLAATLAPPSAFPSRQSDHQRDRYAVRLVAPTPSVMAALRALARASARPAALVLPHVRPSSSRVGAARRGLHVPRGAVVCYALTSPLPLTPPRPLTESLRRRPHSLSVTLPAACATREWSAALPSTESGVDGDLQLLTYSAVVVLPERVVCVPDDAAAVLKKWWHAMRTTRSRQTGSNEGPAVEEKEEEMWEWWWSKRVHAAVEDAGQTPPSRLAKPSTSGVHNARSSTANNTAAHHWNVDLARRLKETKAAEVNEPQRVSEVVPPRLQVQVMKVHQQKSTGGVARSEASAPLCFKIPINEPESATPAASARMSRTVYVVQCVEVLPTPSPLPACVGYAGVIGGNAQLTVSSAPLALKKLQLIRDVCVRGSSSASEAPEKEATAELRVQWTWPLWATNPSSSAAHPTAPAAEDEVDSSTSNTSSSSVTAARLTCAACLTCTPVPPSDQLKSATAPHPAAAVDAVFLQHVESGVTATHIPGLKPSTLYRLKFADVALTIGERKRIVCDGKSVTAITPPAPFDPQQLPQLHYTTLSSKPARKAITPSASSSPPSSVASDATVSEVFTPPAGVEVRFDLPAAQLSPQNLLICPYALLVNLDAVDVAACRSAEDFLAATQSERVAPHLRPAAPSVTAAAGANIASKAAGKAAVVKEVVADMKAVGKEAPVVYVNTSTEKRLRTCITLRQPLQQRYALVFFHAVYHGWGSAASGAGDQPSSNALPISPAAPIRLSSAEKVMYSAPVVKAMHYPSAVRAAYRAPRADSRDVSLSHFRRLLCRPSRLYVQERTPTRLTLRWQLDLSVARLNDLERLRLLRCGSFAVHIIPESGSYGEKRQSPLCSPSTSGTAGVVAAAPASGRTVFYRANVTPLPQRAAPSPTAEAAAASNQHVEPVDLCNGITRRVAACDYLTMLEDTDEQCEQVEQDDGIKVLRVAGSANACLTYELVLPCEDYAAAHTGYTVTVDLLPNWNTAQDGEPLPASASPAASEHTSVRIHVPPVSLPLPAQRVVVTHLTQTSCSLLWTVADGERPAAYVVDYVRHQVRCDCGLEDCVLEPEEHQQLWVRNTQQTSVTLDGLRPHATYTISVMPCNVYDEPCAQNNATITVHTY